MNWEKEAESFAAAFIAKFLDRDLSDYEKQHMKNRIKNAFLRARKIEFNTEALAPFLLEVFIIKTGTRINKPVNVQELIDTILHFSFHAHIQVPSEMEQDVFGATSKSEWIRDLIKHCLKIGWMRRVWVGQEAQLLLTLTETDLRKQVRSQPTVIHAPSEQAAVASKQPVADVIYYWEIDGGKPVCWDDHSQGKIQVPLQSNLVSLLVAYVDDKGNPLPKPPSPERIHRMVTGKSAPLDKAKRMITTRLGKIRAVAKGFADLKLKRYHGALSQLLIVGKSVNNMRRLTFSFVKRALPAGYGQGTPYPER